MAHNLEIKNGQVAFALRGEPAWHELANVTFDESDHISTQAMLDSALLSKWDVRLEEFPLPEGIRSDKPAFMVLRTNPFDGGTDLLSVQGNRYRTYQNEDLFAFGDNLLAGGGFWESAGSINGGRTVFGSLKLGRDIVLDQQGIADVTKMYLLVTTSHDGSSAIQAMTTPVRVVCQNTLNLALNGCKQSFKVRHTATAGGRVDEAQRALGISFAYADQFEAEAQALYATAITNQQFSDIVKAVYPEPDKDSVKSTITRYESKTDTIWDLWNGPTQVGIKGTAWGALNALTERIDYYRAGRGGTNSGVLAGASGFDPVVNAEKNRIMAVVREVAGV